MLRSRPLLVIAACAVLGGFSFAPRDLSSSAHAAQNSAETMSGILQSVDAARGTITFRPEGGAAIGLELTDETRIRVGDKAGSRDDLKPGQAVTCTHITRDGKRICQEITVELRK